MEDIIKIFRLRLMLILKKPVLIILCILLPASFYLFSSQMINTGSNTGKIPIAVVDEDNSESSRKILKDLSSNKIISCSRADRNTALKGLENEKVQGVYIIKDNFEKNIEEGKEKGLIEVYCLRNNKLAPALTEILASEILPFICSNTGAGYIENIYSERHLSTDGIRKSILGDTNNKLDSGSFSMKINLNVEDTASVNKNAAGNPLNIMDSQLVSGLYIIFVSIFLVFSCSSLINERRKKLRDRIVAAGIEKSKIFLGDLSAFIFIGSLPNIVPVILLLHSKNVSAYSIVCILLIGIIYIFCISDILIFFSVFFKNTIAFQSFIIMAVLFMGLVGGCFFSTELMPAGVKSLSAFLPACWAQTAVSHVVITGGITGILSSVLLLLLCGVIFMFADMIISSLQS